MCAWLLWSLLVYKSDHFHFLVTRRPPIYIFPTSSSYKVNFHVIDLQVHLVSLFSISRDMYVSPVWNSVGRTPPVESYFTEWYQMLYHSICCDIFMSQGDFPRDWILIRFWKNIHQSPMENLWKIRITASRDSTISLIIIISKLEMYNSRFELQN